MIFRIFSFRHHFWEWRNVERRSRRIRDKGTWQLEEKYGKGVCKGERSEQNQNTSLRQNGGGEKFQECSSAQFEFRSCIYDGIMPNDSVLIYPFPPQLQ